VSVELPFARYCPYLLENDHILLSNNLLPLSDGAYDPCIDIAHSIHPSGVRLLTNLVGPMQVSSLLKIAEQQGLHAEEVRDILGFLNLVGWLERKRSWSMWLRAIYKQLFDLCIGVRHDLLVWRRHASLQTLCLGIVRATLPVLESAVLLSLCMQAGRLAAEQRIWTTVLFGVGTFLLSVYAHECSHLLFLKSRIERIDVLQVGLRIGLLHKRLTPKLEVQSAVIGPCIGVLVCCVSALAAYLLHQRLCSTFALIIGSFHMLSFLPWYSDGLSIRNALKERKSL